MKKYLHFYFVLPIFILIIVALIFLVWHILPKKTLDLVLLDKTVSISKTVDNKSKTLDYRKHMGLYWILRNNRYVNPLNKSFYDYKTDYFGPVLNKSGSVTEKKLQKIEKIPDLIYLADAYGTGDSKNSVQNGLTLDEIAVVSNANLHGSTVIGEFNITPSNKDNPVQDEIETLFGLKFTNWVGRYIKDLKDLTDVPSWVLDLHERNYGRKWDYSGAGIIIASNNGDLIILEQDKDYSDSLTVQITEAYKKKFGNLKVNYYNWFEIVTAQYGVETVAQYNLPLTKEGKVKFSKVSSFFKFPAILLNNSGNAPTYYFAGDFNDYVAEKRYSDYLFADTVMKIFNYDRKGDITNFYWNFYTPFMQNVLKAVKNNSKNKSSLISADAKPITRMEQKKLEFYDGNAWKPFVIKGFNINSVLPGGQSYNYSRDISVYRYFLTSINDMGGNCVRVYDLMPPEFYRALYEFNLKNPDKKILFYQSIVLPNDITKGEYLSEVAILEQRKNVHYVVDAINGNGEIPAFGKRAGGIYINNVSSYLIGYIAEIDTKQDIIKTINDKNQGYQYSGKYVSGTGSSSPAGNLMALLCDEIFDYQITKYKRVIPVGALGNQKLLPNATWTQYANGIVFDVGSLEIKSQAEGNFFLAYSLTPSDPMLTDNLGQYNQYKDESGEFAYGGYIQTFKTLQPRYPVLIDRVGISTNLNVYEKDKSINGLSELEQGKQLVRILTAIQSQGYMGGLISDLNDNWSNYSAELKDYIIPFKNISLWHNTLDSTQNTGIIAVEPKPIIENGMSLKDSGGRMSEVKLQTDEEYLYMTILLTQETDYTKEKLIIGLDTYHRSFGEYLYDTEFFANSLSGMEFVIKFEGKNQAAIYVVPDYNRDKEKFNPKESYTGKFDLVTSLKYGTFETSNNNFYQTGSTMHIRIPWSLLNFTDPSNKIVISDARTIGEIKSDVYGLQTQSTSGIIFSLLIGDRATKDTLYIFPENKQANGFKSFSWNSWEVPKYEFRNKESFDILSRFFSKKE